MKLPLSDRLLACCKFVHPGDRVADVGCDHGYLGIHLLQTGIASSVLASDMREQPLLTAKNNSARYGVADQIRFYLSDGLQSVPREFDTLVCAGMGAANMISILTAAPWLKSPHYRLILQCQTKTFLLRRFLSEQGWQILQESVLRDGRFLYTVMEAAYRPEEPPLTPGQYFLTPALLRENSPELGEYYFRMRKLARQIVLSKGDQADPVLRRSLEELEALPDDPRYTWLKEAEYDKSI